MISGACYVFVSAALMLLFVFALVSGTVNSRDLDCNIPSLPWRDESMLGRLRFSSNAAWPDETRIRPSLDSPRHGRDVTFQLQSRV